MLTVVVFAVACVVNPGCQSSNTSLTAADQSAIRQLVDAQLKAANARDWAAWAAVYAQDAILLPPNGPSVQGRPAIQAWLAMLPPTSDFRFQEAELDGRADLAYVRGTYSLMITLPGATAPVKEQGKFLQIYRKEADNAWKLARDSFSPDAPLTMPPPAAASKNN